MSKLGVCPKCGDEGWSRERRPNGNDRCVNGHSYPSSTAIMTLDDVNFFIDVEVEGYTRQKELESMSKFELNCLVAMIVNPDLQYADSDLVCEKEGGAANFRLCNAVGEDLDAGTYNYCSNPNDIMPIICKLDFTIKFNTVDVNNRIGSYVTKSNHPLAPYGAFNENPYRAMCIVFILMKEGA